MANLRYLYPPLQISLPTPPLPYPSPILLLLLLSLSLSFSLLISQCNAVQQEVDARLEKEADSVQ